MRVRVLLMSAVVSSAGCFSSPAEDGVGVDALEATYLRAACASLYNCPGYVQTGTLQALAENVTVCPTRLAPLLTDGIADLLASIRAGRVRLDGAAAQRCLARLATTCALDASLEGACREAFIGTLAEGVGCWRTQECVPSAWCDHGAAGACPGVCRPRLPPGGACASAKQCRVEVGMSADCVEGRCVNLGAGTPVGENQACGPTQGAGANDWLQIDCAAGLACFTNLTPRALCRRPLAEGTPCVDGDVCARGTLCTTSAGTTTRSCRRVNVASLEGDACEATSGVVCNPLRGLSCDAATTACVRVGDGAAGGECEPGDLRVGCDAGLFCEPATRRCVARRAVGMACARDAECRSNECADGRCLERVCD